MFAVGDTIAGKYRIERELGRGGMGRVVAATHLQLGTIVALKFLNEEMSAEPQVVARFMREARASAQLRNEHICRVLDFGTENTVSYIVMEMLEGEDLARLVRDQPLDIATAAQLVIQACQGLAEAHAAQIVHRDLKPSNLFLTRRSDGSPLIKVFDFGVAKAPNSNGDEATLTQTESVIGSPGYMSPEQLRSSKTVDARSDIWALGVILYKLTSRRMPFKAESLTELSLQIVMDPPAPLIEVSDEFRAIVMRCLEKDREQRYQTVQELAHALGVFAHAAHTPLDPAAKPTEIFSLHPQIVAEAMRDSSTLGGASAQVMPAPAKPRKPWMIAAAAAIGIGSIAGVFVASSGSPTPAPAPTEVHMAAPVIMKPAPMPAPVPAPVPVKVSPGEAVAAPLAPAPEPIEKPKAEEKKPVVKKPVVKAKPRDPGDPGSSRI